MLLPLFYLVNGQSRDGGILPPNSALLSALPALVLATPAITAVSTASAVFFRAGLVHIERSAVQFVAVERSNGLYALAIIAHFHEGEASGLSGIAIGYHVHAVDRAVRLKKGSKPIFGSAEAEVTYKYVFQLIFFLEFAELRIGGRPGRLLPDYARSLISGLSNYSYRVPQDGGSPGKTHLPAQ
jgi:hypothetical protein